MNLNALLASVNTEIYIPWKFANLISISHFFFFSFHFLTIFFPSFFNILLPCTLG